MNEIWLIRSTFANKDEAISVSRALLAEKLIACANIDEQVTAIFPWEGMLHEEKETAVFMKTSRQKRDAAMKRIKELHSYQIPSILSWQADAADPAFIAWVYEAVQ